MTDAYQFLRDIKKTESRMMRLKIRIVRLEQELLPGGIDYSKDVVQTSPSDRMPDVMAKISELRDDLSAQTVEYIHSTNIAMDVIEKMCDERYARVIFDIYIRGLSRGEVAGDMNYSSSHIKRLIAEAEAAFKRTYDKKMSQNEPK